MSREEEKTEWAPYLQKNGDVLLSMLSLLSDAINKRFSSDRCMIKRLTYELSH